MKNKYYFIICFISIAIGILFFVLQQEIVIINYPNTRMEQNLSIKATKKLVKLIFWHQNKWKTETQELIWHNDTSKNIYYLINNWLTLLDEEKIMNKKVSLQSVLLSPSEHEAYLSFDRNPFSKQQTTFSKWMIIEGLCKTIRKNNITLQQIQLFVCHKPLQDLHLDFSKAWPINGFLNRL